jgi:hypothetical protein
MRLWITLGIGVLAGIGCHRATAPATTQTWNYQANALTNGVVTCTFGAPMTVNPLSTGSGPFSGVFQNGYMACSGPNGASSTVVSGTVDSGSVTGSTVAFQFTSTDVANSGEISEATASFTNNGTINQYTMTGSASVTITLGGQQYVLTGDWQALEQ